MSWIYGLFGWYIFQLKASRQWCFCFCENPLRLGRTMFSLAEDICAFDWKLILDATVGGWALLLETFVDCLAEHFYINAFLNRGEI
jgi:hypothetical protein